MPFLLTESLDPVRREHTHQHIESCAACGAEWESYKETWSVLGDLPEVEVPARVKAQFLAAAGLGASVTDETKPANVIPFPRRKVFQWLAQAAAVVVIAGGAYFAGSSSRPAAVAERTETPAQITGVQMMPGAITPVSLAETRVLDAGALNPEIQGRPNIANLQFVDADPSDDRIGLAFDVTSHWTVTGSPRDKSLVRLLSYMIENEAGGESRNRAIEWVRRTYTDPADADPEITNALAKILRNDSQHEGLRLRAVETLTSMSPSGSSETREALIDALKNDPNPAVRIKAVEALANLARSGEALDAAAVDTLRQKAAQNDEVVYVRVKAAEALQSIK
ncbi:MAG TPA: HEAT repeat domain-containing protein [Thermoanaerobaculia bacterium]|nr:HEAT repeat domain-containing protein [Thermoanaerobaculia bacterium]